MIAKERKVPLKLLNLEAILRRLPPNYPKRPLIEKDYHRIQSGYIGEKALDFYLNQLPKSNYLLFHDLRLNVNGTFFQIDTLLLSDKFALILEIKNIAGKLVFDPAFKQLTRIYQGKETGLLDPITQVKRQQQHMAIWMKQLGLPTLPIEYLVVISHPKSIIEIKSGYSKEYKKICHAAQILDKISEYENIHITGCIPQKEIKKMKRLLNKFHEPLFYSVLNAHDIPQGDVLTGVICPSCTFRPIIRQKGFWQCPSCQFTSKDAHVSALNDYFLIIKPFITNEECKDFLQLHSRFIAYRLLQSLNLPFTGENKGRVYYPLNN